MVSIRVCLTVVSSYLVIQYQMTALHCASINGRAEVVKALLVAGANIHDIDKVRMINCHVGLKHYFSKVTIIHLFQ